MIDYTHLFREPFLSSFRILVEDVIDDRHTFLDESRKIVNEFRKSVSGANNDPLRISEYLLSFNRKWEALLKKEDPAIWSNRFEQLLSLHEKTLAPNETIPLYVTDTQHEERFQHLHNDPLAYSVLKSLKRTGIRLHRGVVRMGFLGKRRKQTGVKWTHKIALRNLYSLVFGVETRDLTFHLFDRLIREDLNSTEVIFSFYEQLYKESLDAISAHIRDTEEKYEFSFDDRCQFILQEIEKEKAELSELDHQFEEEILQVFEDKKRLFDSLYAKAGTIELSNSALSEHVQRKKLKKWRNAFTRHFFQWQNTRHALLDDWSLSDEVFAMDLASVQKVEELVIISRDRVNKDILPKANSVNKYLEETVKAVRSVDEQKQLITTLKKQLYQSRKTLDNQLLSELVDSILKQNFTGLVSGVENSLNVFLEELSEKRTITSVSHYDQPIGKDKLSRIEPRELIKYSVLPVLEKDLFELSSTVQNLQSEMIRKSSNIGQTLNFGLQAGIEQLESANADELETIRKNISDSLDRTIGRGREFMELTKELERTFLDRSRTIVADLISNSNFLTINQNAIDLKIKLVRAKAVDRSRSWRKNIRARIKEGLKDLSENIQMGYEYLQGKIFQVQKLTGITKESVANVKISEFLTQSWSSIQALPFFYQKLFSLGTLTDISLFTNRTEELKVLESTINAWEKDNYANAALIGEKGSGKSSLIHFFLKKYEITYPVQGIETRELISDPKELYRFLSESLKVEKPFRNQKDLLEFVDSLPSKQIFIIKNAEKLFIRMIGGFEAMREFLEIISLTNRRILWLVTFNQFAWDYLCNALEVDDVFEFRIQLDDFEEEDLRKAIEIRNQISGYNIEYIPSESDLNSKNYKGLSSSEQQDYLRKRYFNQLRRFSRSNISLAMIMWMISATEKDEETIVVNPIDRPDLSFVSNLSRMKVFILHLLVLHGDMSVSDIATSLRISDRKSKMELHTMMEDGILQVKRENYVINPIIYRFIVQLLKERNLIH